MEYYEVMGFRYCPSWERPKSYGFEESMGYYKYGLRGIRLYSKQRRGEFSKSRGTSLDCTYRND